MVASAGSLSMRCKRDAHPDGAGKCPFTWYNYR